ncbi:DedA family protein [Candidatus Micrarchaeota archaeon]|nr:DedA family protein [Candidatus Micrarchaeota archaeon]
MPKKNKKANTTGSAVAAKKTVTKPGQKHAQTKGLANVIGKHKPNLTNEHKQLLKHATLGIAIIILSLLALDFLAAEFPQSYQAAENFVKQYGLPGVFVIVFLGSSMLPFPTDVSYAIAIKLFAQNPLPVIAVAIIAAFLGSVLNYWMAYYLREKFVERFLEEKDLDKASGLFNKYGPIPIILFGFIPASPIFDPLTFVAGLTRMEFKKFAFYSFISRVLHFGVLAAGVLAFKLI